MDEIIMPADYDLDCDYIDDDWFAGDDFRKSIDKKAETVAIFDCCHSGTMFDLPYTMHVTGDDDKWERKEEHPKDDGFFFYLSGCQDSQTSAEITTTSRSVDGQKVTERFGAMTNTLTKLITDGYFEKSIREFLEKLREIVGENKNEDGSAQAPNICCTRAFHLEDTTFAKMCDGIEPGAEPETADGAESQTADDVQPETTVDGDQPETVDGVKPETADGVDPESGAAEPEITESK